MGPETGWKWERWSRDNVRTPKAGSGGTRSGWEGQTPCAESGPCRARQVPGRGRSLGAEPLRGGAGAGPAGGVRLSAPGRAAGAAELELDLHPEPGPGRESGPRPGRSGLQRYGVSRLQAEFPKGGDPAHHQDAGAPGVPASPSTCRVGGWAGPGDCANLACREIGGPAGSEGDTEARAGAEPVGLYPRAPFRNLASHTQLPLGNILLPAAAAATLG